ncbi:GGDEF domain-containing protein [Neorhizobium sp. JUb45]|uniref:GGDEF domain-containing protein n=1 Tax=unclassified Neorhizobium TaxID=2629175 RepID=UPI00104D9721|nr:GGDEF domain-containing protein [Neorhizobium sp. JUb45]
MMLDYNSLLLALGFSAICLLVALFATWASRRSDSFMLTWVVSLALIIVGIFSYSAYTLQAGLVIGAISYFFIMAGFSVMFAAGCQFRTGRSPLRVSMVAGSIVMVLGLPAMLMGYDGISIIMMNVTTAILLTATAREYWLVRHEAPGPLIGMASLYATAGVSFALCACVLIRDQQWVIGHAPQNWAEKLNIAICIASMTGVGAFSLALHQWRLAAFHRREAMTDPLTGLLNRRAVFEKFGAVDLDQSTAVIVFDIDRFKSINDQHGHAAGDIVIRAFAQEMKVKAEKDSVARLGGEEFVVVIKNVLPGRAERIAERIRRGFAERMIDIGGKTVSCTASAGIAFGTKEGRNFDTVLNLADGALYEAKRAGRNRIAVAGFLHAVDLDEARTTA